MIPDPLDPRLGRLPAADPRDYPMRRLLAEAPSPPRPRPWPMFRPPLDQGQEGTCVGHGWKHWMLVAPTIQTTPTRSPTAVEIYDEATFRDEWEGNERDRSFGTSVRAGAKALQARGILGVYAFAQSVEDVLAWLSGHGPVVVGLDWHETMMVPDAEGIIRASGPVYGGHCVALDWWDARRGLLWGPNSWGRGWGPRKGRFALPVEDLGRLLAAGGDACTAVETRGRA
jgi:hypothetical protein